MSEPITFHCDAMLGGLARWLRAAGYEARFDVHVRDGELVRRALQEGAVLLTSDSGIMERYAVSEGLVRALFVALGLSPLEQLARVMGRLELPLRPSRCMSCGGRLRPTPLAEVAGEVPAGAREAYEEFFRCAGCGKVFWRGTHWQSISRKLRQAVEAAGGGAEPC